MTEIGRIEAGGATAKIYDFENVIGTAFDDTIFGNAQNNVLLGGDGDDALHPFGGADFVDGGAGTDVLLLNGFAVGQFVDIAAGVAGNAKELAEGAQINRFVNIENVNGSSVAGDLIIGDDGKNVISGLAETRSLAARAMTSLLVARATTRCSARTATTFWSGTTATAPTC